MRTQEEKTKYRKKMWGLGVSVQGAKVSSCLAGNENLPGQSDEVCAVRQCSLES